MTKVLFATSEAAPFFKTGGLGDVAYALPKALANLGNDLRVVVPYYPSKMPLEYKNRLKDLGSYTVMIGGWKKRYVGVKTLKLDQVTYYFIDNLEYFGRSNLYGYWDDGERFAFFQLAALELLNFLHFVPDIIHANDWQTAFIPVLLRTSFAWKKELQAVKTVITIHNIQFQGYYHPDTLENLFGLDYGVFRDDGARVGDQINWLKGGINFADAVTTVSPTYAQEIMTPEFGEGLDGVIRNVSYKVSGILNGIDEELYNPQTDQHLWQNYSDSDISSGKRKNKIALQKKLGLPENPQIPLFVMISRLTRQKGADLLAETLNDFLVRHQVQVVVLGTGDSDLEERLKYYANTFPHQMKTIIDFNSDLAQKMYAAADVFLMPSAFEPCGLSQMMAMHYGTIPLVHAVGGLTDTVEPYNLLTGTGNGFSFVDYSSVVLGQMLELAHNTYYHSNDFWLKMQKRDLKIDFSWQKPALKYQELYDRVK